MNKVLPDALSTFAVCRRGHRTRGAKQLTKFPILLSAFLLSIVFVLNGPSFVRADQTALVQLTAGEQSWLKQNPDKLTLYYNVEFPPIEFASDSGAFAGMGADIIALIEKRLGIQFIKTPSRDWNKHLAALENGECAVAPTIVSTPERRLYAFFTSPYAVVPVVMITSKAQHSRLTFDDLTGLRVAVVSGYATEKYARDKSKNRFEVTPVENVSEGLRAVAFGQADVLMENIAVASYFINRQGIANLRVAGNTDFAFAWSIGVSRKYPLLFSAVQKALDTIPEGEIERIRKRWISLEPESGMDPQTRRLLQVIGVFAVLLIIGLTVISLVFKHRLNEKVATLKTAQQELLDQSEILRLATEVTQAGIWDSRLTEQKIYLNAQWLAMLGYEPEERTISLSEFDDFVHPEDRTRLHHFFGDYVAGGGYMQFENEYRLRRVDGSWCWVLSKGRAVEWDSRNVPSRIIGLDMNIQKIKDDQEKMAQNEAWFRAIFENAPYSIVINRVEDGKYIDANKIFLDRWNIGREELAHYSPGDFLIIPREEMTEFYDQLLKTGSVKNREVEVMGKNGPKGYLIFSSVVLNVGGQKQILSMTADVTERKLAEMALKESEARIREMIDNAPFGAHSYQLDASGELIFTGANPAADRILGIDHDPLIGKTTEEAFPMLKQTNVPSAYREVALTGRRWEEDVVFYEDQNISGVFEVFAFQTGPGRMTAFFLDITERKKAEEELRENRELLSATFNATADGVLVVDNEGKISQMNRQFAKMWRIPEDLQKALEDEKLLSFVTDQLVDPERFLSRVRELYKSSREDLEEIRFKDGRVFERYSCPMIREGKEAGRVWDFRDITLRKQAEEALRTSEAGYRRLYNSMMDAYVRVDMDGIIRECNNAFLKMIGYQADEIKKLTYQDITPEKWRVREAWIIENQILTRGFSDTYEKEYILRDGSILPVELRTYLLRDDEGKPAGMWAIIRDITERRRADEEREKMQGQMLQSQKLEAVGVLAGGVAHDFNNILSAIIGYTELMMGKMNPSDPNFKNLSKILDAAQRSANLTRQLLAFARKQTIVPIIFDINESIGSLLKMIRRLIGENIELVWMPGAGPCYVRMDPSQFDQTLLNLCVNARDAISSVGRIAIQTQTVSFDQFSVDAGTEFMPGEFVVLSVSDDGRGMDKETLNHIFEPFFTTKGIGEGTGMGLATVYGIVKQHNGFINVFSEPGRGSILKIFIPRYDAGYHPVEQEQTKTIPRSKGEAVLLVEDDPTVLEMIMLMLQHLGYAVITAGSPKEAIRVAEKNTSDIHLFITDIIMPEMNGRELADRLRAIRPEIKHLFMSGYTADVIAHQGVLDDSINFIHKPFTLKDLAIKIREVLDGSVVQ